MKQLFLTALACLSFLVGNQAQTYQDTTFTDPVLISFPLDFVTFQNCHFVGITGDALTLEGAGAFISNCTFENIQGNAIYAFGSEVYVVEDTFSNVTGRGIHGWMGSVVVLGSVFSFTEKEAIVMVDCEVGEVSDSHISDAGSGIIINGGTSNGEYVLKNNLVQRIYSFPSSPLPGNGIVVQNGASVSIEQCVVDSCLGVGIIVNDFGDPTTNVDIVKVQENKISRTGPYGMSGGDKVYHAVVRNNEISYPGYVSGWSEYGEHALVWAGPDALIEGNHIHHALDTVCDLGQCADGILVSTSATLTRNHIHDCTGIGIEYREFAAAGNNPLLIFNNIIHDVGGNSILYNGEGSLPDYSEPSSTLIRNNTLHNVQSAPLAACCNDNPIIVEGNILIFEAEADTSKYIQTPSSNTLTDNLNLKAPGDLGFVDYSGRDFHLASESSPAHNILPLNFGLPNDDFDGDPRLGLRDAGADELNLTEIICGCNNCPNIIPDLFFGDFTFAVLSADNNDLAGSTQGVCGVRVEFQHDYIGDVTMELISPSGQTVQLVGPNGFWGSTNLSTWNVGFVPCSYPSSPDPGFSAVWNSNQIWGESGTYTGTYFPATGCLEDFNNGSVTGNWTLRVFDNQVNDNGTVLGFEVMFCDMSGVSCFVCSEPPVAQFSTSLVGGWAATIGNESTGGTTNIDIDFGDGQTESGTFFQVFHEYENVGSYLVRLIATNDCGVDTFSQIVQIAGALPSAFVYAEPDSGCSPLVLQTVVINSDHVDTWHWFFPGGVPAESFEMAPTVTYPVPGDYSGSLIVENEVGSTTLDSIFSAHVLPGLLNPGFMVQSIGDSLVCTNTTQNAVGYYWSLNGGTPVGNNTSPYVFEVDSSGTYTIGLTLADLCDTSTLTQEVTVLLIGAQNLEQEGWRFGISPNPNDGHFVLHIAGTENLPADIVVLNALGETLFKQKIAIAKGENVYPFDLAQMPPGVYFLQIQTAKGRMSLRMVIG